MSHKNMIRISIRLNAIFSKRALRRWRDMRVCENLAQPKLSAPLFRHLRIDVCLLLSAFFRRPAPPVITSESRQEPLWAEGDLLSKP